MPWSQRWARTIRLLVASAALVIATSVGFMYSAPVSPGEEPTAVVEALGTAGAGATSSGVGRIQKPAASDTHARCPSVARAIKFYAGRIVYWRDKMGAGAESTARSMSACPRYLAHVLQRRSYGMRREYGRWHSYQYDWASWMPDKWQRIGACETGYGRRPGDFHWNSGPYQGFAGFAVSSWDSFRLAGYPSEAYLATPRQQYEVALAIWRRYGFSGWGCRSA